MYAFLNKQRIPIDFENGLSGIGWGIELLVQNGFIEADTNEVLEDLDARIFSEIAHSGNKSFSMSMNDGLQGFALYCIRRLQGDGTDFETRFLLERILADLINKMAVHAEHGSYAVNDVSGFNILWNIPVNLYVLSEALRLNLFSNKIEKILAHIEPKLCSLLPLTHVNRAFLLYGMQSVQCCYSSEKWRNHINHLKNNTDPEHIWIHEMNNMNRSLATGASGALWVLERLNNCSLRKEPFSSPRNWNNHVESTSFLDKVFDGLKSANANPGLMHGYSGMLMAILFAGISEKKEVVCS